MIKFRHLTPAVPDPAAPPAPPFMERLLGAIDEWVKMIYRRRYKGANPVIAAVYGPLRASAIVMLAITLITLVFGLYVPVESAAIAKGSVVVYSKRKTVQHLEGGIVKRILVEEGQLVQQGDPLLEISDVAPKANREIVQAELWGQRATEQRLVALREGRDQLLFSEAMLEAAAKNPDLANTMKTQTELFISQRDTQLDKLKTLRQRIAQSREEIVGLEAQIRSGAGQLELINEEIASVQDLLRQGLATRPRLLALQRQGEELRGNRGQNIAMIAKVGQAINETEMQIINQQNEFTSALADELRDVRGKISDNEEKLRAVDDVMSRTVITSPSEGIVTGLKFHTVGGVIAPGTPILDIVPQGEQLVLEIHVLPADIDVVKPGLETRVIFPAYKARRMPLFTGKVTKVSADAFTEQQGAQTVSYYTARVEVDTKQMEEMKSPIALYPGMEADVFIHVGARSFIAYLMSPVTDSMDRAFKEE